MPQVKITVTTTPVKYDNSKTESQLKGFKIDTVNPYGTQVETEVGGLMSGGLQMKSNIQIAWETDKRSACFWYHTIEVIMHIDPTIYIAKEFSPGSCMYNAVLAHEMKHIETDREVAKYWRPRLQRYLQQQIDRVGVYGPVPAARQVEVRAKMTQLMKTSMEQASQPIDTDRRARQQAIDNRAEYERVNALCR